MRNSPPSAIRLRGVRYPPVAAVPPKVWLNDKLLSLEKSLKIKSHSIHGFGWGKDRKGSLQLALAICLELYPECLAVHIAPQFQALFLDDIVDDNFDLYLDLATFNKAIFNLLLT